MTQLFVFGLASPYFAASTAELVRQCCCHFFSMCGLLICISARSWSVFVHKSLLLILFGQCTLTVLCRYWLRELVDCLLFSTYMSQDSDAYTKTAFTFEMNILTLVALPMILDFHNLSIARKLFWLFPVYLYILFNASSGTYYTSQICELLDFSSTGPSVKLTSCLQAVCHHLHNFAFVFVDS